MATVEECEQALHELAGRMATSESARRKAGVDRTMTCTIRDLGVVFGGRLADGRLLDIRQVQQHDAQVRLSMTSEDLLALMDGRLKMASAWATGRVKVEAGFRDIMKLRSLF